jgi:hypothetical protein
MSGSRYFSESERKQFTADGCFVRRVLFAPGEIAAMLLAVEGDPLIKQHMFD